MRSGRKKIQFAVGMAIILGTLSWLAYSGIQETKTYYVTVKELTASPDAYHRRFRVAGDVANGSVQRAAGRVQFQLSQEGKLLPIVYTGTDPIPDTLRDGAQAVVDGRYLKDGTFQADTVQAKCASKYEAAPPQGSKNSAGSASGKSAEKDSSQAAAVAVP